MARRLEYRQEDECILSIDDAGNERVKCRLSFMNAEEPLTILHSGLSLRILAFSDYRSQDIDQVISFVQELPKAHLIVYAGDDVDRFRAHSRNRFEELARLSGYGLCAVAGNDDRGDAEAISGERVYDVHKTPVVVGSFVVVGLEGAPAFPSLFGPKMNLGTLLYPEPQVVRQLKKWDHFRDKTAIVVSHTPPYGVLDRAIRWGDRSIGNRPLRTYLSHRDNAILCICGHVHSQSRKSESIGTCTIVNAASHDGRLDPGNLAEIVISKGAVQRILWHTLTP